VCPISLAFQFVTGSERLKVAVVDDDPDFRDLLVELVRVAGGDAIAMGQGQAAVAAIDAGEVHAVVTDYRLPGRIDGEGVVRACRSGGRNVPVAIVSVVDSVDVALHLMRLGANDYLVKPSSPEEMLERLRKFLDHARIQIELTDLREYLERGNLALTHPILGNAPSLTAVLRLLPRAARSGAPVLILGESGTGKELVARAVHEASRRSAGPFVAVDCASIPEALFENELFGHRRGAFSDAREDRVGLVQKADGGTLFLDEAGELPATVQAKLLRFLQTHEYRRLGDTTTLVSDARLIAATNRDLEQEVVEGRFREDLYFRLNVIPIRLPPLRDRREDIPVLATAFLKRYAQEFESPATAFDPAGLAALVSRPWPGNVRELENAVQRAVAMALGPVITAADLAPEEGGLLGESRAAFVDDTMPFHPAKTEIVKRFEREYARRLIRRHVGNVSAAAREAGLDRKSLSRLLERHGLSVAEVLTSG